MTGPPITYRGCVYPSECDHMNHLNVAAYVNKFDQATWNFFTDLGLTREFLDSNGTGLAAVQQNIAYQRALRPGDVLTIRSTLIELAGKRIRFRHEMTNGATGDVEAVAELLALCIDTGSRKSRAFPEDLVSRVQMQTGGTNP
ncbi:MAG: thioesterase family protein [Rhodospirillaceae bacterium]